MRESEQGDHQGPALWNEMLWSYKELLTGAELTLRQLHHQGHPIMGNKPVKAGTLAPTTQPAGGPTVEGLLQSAQLVRKCLSSPYCLHTLGSRGPP